MNAIFILLVIATVLGGIFFLKRTKEYSTNKRLPLYRYLLFAMLGIVGVLFLGIYTYVKTNQFYALKEESAEIKMKTAVPRNQVEEVSIDEREYTLLFTYLVFDSQSWKDILYCAQREIPLQKQSEKIQISGILGQSKARVEVKLPNITLSSEGKFLCQSYRDIKSYEGSLSEWLFKFEAERDTVRDAPKEKWWGEQLYLFSHNLPGSRANFGVWTAVSYAAPYENVRGAGFITVVPREEAFLERTKFVNDDLSAELAEMKESSPNVVYGQHVVFDHSGQPPGMRFFAYMQGGMLLFLGSWVLLLAAFSMEKFPWRAICLWLGVTFLGVVYVAQLDHFVLKKSIEVLHNPDLSTPTRKMAVRQIPQTFFWQDTARNALREAEQAQQIPMEIKTTIQQMVGLSLHPSTLSFPNFSGEFH